MATMFAQESYEGFEKEDTVYDLYAELSNHAWHPEFTAADAEKELAGQFPFTYLTRPCDYDKGFMISFVNEEGVICHDHFSLIDRSYAIWRNSSFAHVGNLHKVIRHMMHCDPSKGQPLG